MQFVIHTKYIVEKHTVSSEQLQAHGYVVYMVYSTTFITVPGHQGRAGYTGYYNIYSIVRYISGYTEGTIVQYNKIYFPHSLSCQNRIDFDKGQVRFSIILVP